MISVAWVLEGSTLPPPLPRYEVFTPPEVPSSPSPIPSTLSSPISNRAGVPSSSMEGCQIPARDTTQALDRAQSCVAFESSFRYNTSAVIFNVLRHTDSKLRPPIREGKVAFTVTLRLTPHSYLHHSRNATVPCYFIGMHLPSNDVALARARHGDLTNTIALRPSRQTITNSTPSATNGK
ncbi:hypothetical protein BGW80DRAFT_1464554 [Lactifluus volemus]|nr:hypothetical protein BGW80DRAFT_1464554 [Lactifluus volemus]